MKQLFAEIPTLRGARVTLRALTPGDADALRELTACEEVYRYLPTFLAEKQFDDPSEVIRHLYTDVLADSLILGIFTDDAFCGLAEFYGYRTLLPKVSVGIRMLPRCWGQGISSETLALMVNAVFEDTDVEVITASSMIENQASAKVLQKNGFRQVAHAVPENWGTDVPVLTDKWLRQYRFQA